MIVQPVRAVSFAFTTFPAWPFLGVDAHPEATGGCIIRWRRRDVSAARLEWESGHHEVRGYDSHYLRQGDGPWKWIADPLWPGEHVGLKARASGAWTGD